MYHAKAVSVNFVSDKKSVVRAHTEDRALSDSLCDLSLMWLAFDASPLVPRARWKIDLLDLVCMTQLDLNLGLGFGNPFSSGSYWLNTMSMQIRRITKMHTLLTKNRLP